MPKKSKRVQSDIHIRDRAATRPDTKHSEEAHQTSSPLMAASSDLKGNYDVFLSFRGTDVRNNFLSHLYAALDQKGIYTYIDSEELRKGKQITPALIKAIEDSRIAIIIFSKDYASSPWCLKEVEKIMECKEQRGLIVFPVFYKVEPKEVRTPRGSYREAMVKHENKFGRDSEEVKRWEKALLDAGSLSGWELKDKDEAEADLIKRIVQEISMQLDRTPLHVAKHPVGIPRQVVKLKSMLNLESCDDVLMIGLWGQGGIGKTTLAKALYNDIFRGFEASCFLANVRETSKDSKDLVHLQEKLLSEILVEKELTVFNVDGGINLMQHRLCRKRVLLVLDDVNDVKQLNALAGGREWFGKGSRIIITTRDNHLLTVHEIDEDHIYEVNILDDWEALELFNKHAFPGSKEKVMRRDLVDGALHYADGLPLALVVLGSYLCGRREQEWASALNKLDKSPDKTINDVLKLSYDGLEDCEKEIFLDIACFFKGKSIQYIMEVLNSCDFDTTIGVQVLVEKSLITKEMAIVHMHDLIQLMGMDIVKQECHDDLGRRSRLWLCEDVRDVLSGDMGTDSVKAIVLDLPTIEAISIGPDAFTNMRRLRLLIMINVHSSFQGPIYLPNNLRWFQWPECPFSILKFPPGPKKLVKLDLCKSNIQVVVDQFKDFKNLKFLCFRECLSMVCMPNLNLTPNLEKLDLYGCKNLEYAHQSVAYHAKLRWLNLEGCSNLHHLPDVLQTKNLQLLNLTGCSKLERFPDIPNKMKRLQELSLKGTSIKELPASIENLVSLVNLSLVNCKKMTNLPSSIYNLPELVYLLLDGCSKLIKFPKEEDSSDLPSKTRFPNLQILTLGGCNLLEVEFLEKYSCFPNLRALDLSENNFAELPMCPHLHDLRESDVSECQQLQKIGSVSMKLRDLAATNCESLSKIPSDVLSIGRLSGLCLGCKVRLSLPISLSD
ncbi:disease resistance protein RPV1 [Eucalyptus grandis]|uniref:disease resistance protein RPV1 n=1 Tax=Eucalyptus grandis TaxID=71139 RepID=UPI00192EC288|nr:disease resistance protein RPV1 [Eucalyptus grandis]